MPGLCPLFWGEFYLSIPCSSKWLDKSHNKLAYLKTNLITINLQLYFLLQRRDSPLLDSPLNHRLQPSVQILDTFPPSSCLFPRPRTLALSLPCVSDCPVSSLFKQGLFSSWRFSWHQFCFFSQFQPREGLRTLLLKITLPIPCDFQSPSFSILNFICSWWKS